MQERATKRRQSHQAEDVCTAEEIRQGMVTLAYVVERYGERYAPLLERLEREYETAMRREPPRERARRILAAHTRVGDLKAIR